MEKVEILFPIFSDFMHNFSRFTKKNVQIANMAHFVAFYISFQKIVPPKIPLGGYWWLNDYCGIHHEAKAIGIALFSLKIHVATSDQISLVIRNKVEFLLIF